MRRSFVVAGVLFALALAFVAVPSLFASPSSSDVAPETETQPNPDIVRLEGSEGGFWPFLNSRKSFERRSPINVVVRGDAEEVVRLLREADADWEETEADEEEADQGTFAVFGGNETDGNETGVNGTEANETANVTNVNATDANETDANESDSDAFEFGSTQIRWSPTTGATRYAYVDNGTHGWWVDETLQLHDGDYYGQRYHIRLYESPNPDDEWVAMQTHSEHFDWFTLRHRVDGVEAAQTRLEDDFTALPGIDKREDVSRVYLGNEGPSDANGWASIVELVGMALAPLAVGLTVGRRLGAVDRVEDGIERRLSESDRRRIALARERVDPRHLLLVGTILAIVLGVRIAGVALERRVDFLTMHAIAALLYPFIGLGLPAATYLLANGLERRLDAAVVAGGSLAIAIWIDYALLGIDSLPIDVVIQRMLVVVALGLIAGGAAKRATRHSRWNGMLIDGAVVWVLVLVGTLFGYF